MNELTDSPAGIRTADMSRAIEWLFKRFCGTYGASWARQWEGTPMSEVKSVWEAELSCYVGRPDAIRFALDNLPERPPNALQFRNLCRVAPPKTIPVIEVSKAAPEVIAAVLAGLKPVDADNPHGSKAWAHRLKAQHDAGGKLNVNQVQCYRAALGII